MTPAPEKVLRARYENFLRAVAARGQVFALRGPHGDFPFAWSQRREGAKVLLFWSGHDAADACAREEWSTYRPVPLALAEFRRRFLPGAAVDDTFIGPDWDGELFGSEVTAEELAADLATAEEEIVPAESTASRGGRPGPRRPGGASRGPRGGGSAPGARGSRRPGAGRADSGDRNSRSGGKPSSRPGPARKSAGRPPRGASARPGRGPVRRSGPPRPRKPR